MRRGCGRMILFCLALLCAALLPAASAGAAIEPPWCGTPTPDAIGSLPDGTQPGDPPGSFPHIPYYAIGCTLDRIQSQSNGRMEVEVIGQSALGRDLYGVTINALDTTQQRKDFQSWQEVRRLALSDPARGQALVRPAGAEIKVPIFIQAAIHGNESEGVDASMRLIEELATTPYGEDPAVDAALDHTIMVFNIDQNPDGRIANTRTNGNGFDLNRDYLTQSQPETTRLGEADAGVVAAGGARPARLRQPDADRGDDQAAQPEHRVRQLAQVEPAADRRQRGGDERRGLRTSTGRSTTGARTANLPPAGSSTCAERRAARARPRPRRWDDWGPFYTAMFAQHIGPRLLDGRDVQQHRVRRPARLAPGADDRRPVDDRLRHRPPRRHALRHAGELPARRRRTRRGRRAARRRSTSTTTGCSSTRRRTSSRRAPASAATRRPTGSSSGCCSTASRSPSSSRTTRSAARRSSAGPTWCRWRRRAAGWPTPRCGSASTSPRGSASSTRRRRRGATATSGAPTWSRSTAEPRSRRRPTWSPSRTRSSRAASSPARRIATRSRSTRRPRCGP